MNRQDKDIILDTDQIEALKKFMVASMEFTVMQTENNQKIADSFKAVVIAVAKIEDKIRAMDKLYNTILGNFETRLAVIENASIVNPYGDKPLN